MKLTLTLENSALNFLHKLNKSNVQYIMLKYIFVPKIIKGTVLFIFLQFGSAFLLLRESSYYNEHMG